MSFLAAFVFILSLMPGAISAQTVDEGKGVAADASTKASATTFVRTFTDLFNQHDLAVYDLAIPTYWAQPSREEFATYLQNTTPITLYGIGSVKTHTSTGHISVEVWYSGVWTASTYWTKRWYLQVVNSGYIIDHVQQLTPKAAGNLVVGTADLTLANDGLSMNTADFTEITLMILKTTNADAARALTTGLYEIPDGVSAEDAQATLAGDFGAYRYLGPTPLAPGGVLAWAFLVEPGRHYLVQEFTLDPNLQNPQIMQGANFALTFDIA
jgi:hypothetical protein